MSKFTQSQIDAIESRLETISESDVEQMYRDMLDDVYGPAKIGGYEYDHATALESVDPTAYRCGFADYTSSLLEDYTEYLPGQYVATSDLEDLLLELESA